MISLIPKLAGFPYQAKLARILHSSAQAARACASTTQLDPKNDRSGGEIEAV
jgi:hypothetical protein